MRRSLAVGVIFVTVFVFFVGYFGSYCRCLLSMFFVLVVFVIQALFAFCLACFRDGRLRILKLVRHVEKDIDEK